MALDDVTDRVATGVVPNDLEAFWMPFTANRAFKKRPRLIARAKDMHYYTPEGKPILDGVAGLWCTNPGHNRTEIVEAIRASASELDFAPTFQFGHPSAFTVASRIAALAPGDLDHVFFCNSGSEAVDTALKIALAYQNVPTARAPAPVSSGRERGYHGVGFGGISVGGMVNNRKCVRCHAHRASTICRTTHLTARTRPSPRASRRTAPTLADALEAHRRPA